jgi:hypothetical protein
VDAQVELSLHRQLLEQPAPPARLPSVRDAVREPSEPIMVLAEVAVECISRRGATVEQRVNVCTDAACRDEHMCCSF